MSRMMALAAALGMMSMGGVGGNVQVIPRGDLSDPVPPGAVRSGFVRGGNNRRPGLTFAEKKRRRKIAYASKRTNRLRAK